MTDDAGKNVFISHFGITGIDLALKYSATDHYRSCPTLGQMMLMVSDFSMWIRLFT